MSICVPGVLKDKADLQRGWGVEPRGSDVSAKERLRRFYYVHNRAKVCRMIFERSSTLLKVHALVVGLFVGVFFFLELKPAVCTWWLVEFSSRYSRARILNARCGLLGRIYLDLIIGEGARTGDGPPPPLSICPRQRKQVESKLLRVHIIGVNLRVNTSRTAERGSGHQLKRLLGSSSTRRASASSVIRQRYMTCISFPWVYIVCAPRTLKLFRP